MSSFIPMVSSSPPPMDGGFGWDEDDDEFGTFTGADDSSSSFQAATDTGVQSSKGADISPSPGLAEDQEQESDPWQQSNGQAIQEHKDSGDSNFTLFPEDSDVENSTNDTKEISDTRPSRIDITPDTENKIDDTINTEMKGDNKGPLTDSGLFSADISPVQNFENVHDNIREDTDSLASSSGSSPPLHDAQKCTDEEKLGINNQDENLENVQCETESDIQESDKFEQPKYSEDCEIERTDSPCPDSAIFDANCPSNTLRKSPEDSSQTDSDHCDNIPVHQGSCSNTLLVTDNVQESPAPDSESDVIEGREPSETVLTSDSATTDHCDNDVKDSCDQEDAAGSPDTDLSTDSDLRKSDDLSDPPDQQVVSDSAAESISQDVNSSSNEEDFCEFASTSVEQSPVPENKEEEMSGQHEIHRESARDSTHDNSASETSNFKPTTQDTEDWGDFGSVPEQNGNEQEIEVCDGNHSESSGHIPVTVSTEVENVNDDSKLDTSVTSETPPSEDKKNDQNNSYSQKDVSSFSAFKSSDPEVKNETIQASCDDDEDEFGNFSVSGTSADINLTSDCDKSKADTFGTFKDHDEKVDADDNDDFGKFNEADDFGSFDKAEGGFAAFGDSSGAPEVGEVSDSKSDFGSFGKAEGGFAAIGESSGAPEVGEVSDSKGDFGSFDKAEGGFAAFGDSSEAPEVGEVSDSKGDFGSFDKAEGGFAAFGDSSEATEVGEVSDSKGDWASFSEPQVVTAVEPSADDDDGDDDDEWAAFNEEQVQTSTSPPQSSQALPKMSPKEKLTFAVTTVFPSVHSVDVAFSGLTDLDSFMAERAELRGEVSVWLQIKAVHTTDAVTYQYTKSHWNDCLFGTLRVDTRNVLIGHKKAPVPIFASGLTLLEPTKGTSTTLQPEVLVDTSKPPETAAPTQEAIPPAQFDWSSSGLKNPLEADNKTLNLDFLIQDQGIKSNALESEFLGSEKFMAPSKSSMQPLENILANMKGVSTLRPINTQETVSQEADKVVGVLPSLSFMKSKVLMFPLKLDQ